jgi:ribonuclease BN (tRNA processing enzyme)
MIEKDNILITENDYLTLYVIGYENQGESIVLSVGDKFLGVIDCFKVGTLFETKRIIKEIGIPLDFICWTHVDWDHSYGLSDLKEFTNENTAIIIPEGYASTEIRNIFLDSKHYIHDEYRKIYNIIDDTEPDLFISANDNTEIFNFKFNYNGDEFDFVMKSFSPLSKIIRDLNKENIKDTILSVNNNNYTENEIGSIWYDGHNTINNLFSIGLEIVLKLKSEDIRICLTGDLDNDVIEKMKDKKINRIFRRNTILKIPHHGSSNASELIDFKYNTDIAYKYAITTSFKKVESPLPKKEILDKYLKFGKVYRTDKESNDKFGIVKYTYPLIHSINLSLPQEIELIGDAGEAI